MERRKHRLFHMILTGEIWDLRISLLGLKSRNWLDTLKIVLVTFKDFSRQKVGLRAVSLAYFSVMALVPCFALAFSVTKGFGFSDDLEGLLLNFFSDRQDIIQQIMSYAENILSVTSNGWFGIITFLTFIWLVFWLMFQVESAFNYVLKTSAPRKIWKRISTYIALVITLPFVIIMFLATMLQFTQGNGLLSLVNIPFWEEISDFMSWVIIYAITVLILTMMYKYIPSCKIPVGKAFKSAWITGIAFSLFQVVYVTTQIFFNRWNAVFGALAAIPFLMIWLNISWFIILFGAKLLYAFMNHRQYKPE